MSERRKFAHLLSRVARKVTTVQSSEICCADLTLEQFQTLRAIDAAEEAPSLGTLSGEMGVDLSTMSRNVTVLERNEYVLRTRSAEDGRVVTVKLTTKGRRALATLRCGEEETFEAIYARVPAGERANVIKSLELLESCLCAVKDGACCSPAATPGRRRAS